MSDPATTTPTDLSPAAEAAKPEADQELAAVDDVTVDGGLTGSGSYLIRFSTEKDRNMVLLLESDSKVKATLTDEEENTVREFTAEETGNGDEGTFKSRLVFKARQGRSFLIRVSGSSPASFSVRIVRKSILDAEEENGTETEETAEEPSDESADESADETAGDPADEPTVESADGPADESGEESGEEPAGETGEESGSEQPGGETADSLTEEAGSNPAEESSKNPEEEPENLPETKEPGTEEPGAEEPGTEKPETEETETEETGTEETGAEAAGSEEPGTEETGAETAGTEEPGTEEPEAEAPKAAGPEADREITVGEDTTVDGELDGNGCLIRFTPDENRTLVLLLTSAQELSATVTDEQTGAVKALTFYETDENGENTLILAYYKVQADNTYLVRISGSESAEYSLRLVKKSILQAEEDLQPEEPAEEPEEEPAENSEEEPAENSEEESAEEPEEESTENPEEEPAEEPTDEPEEEPEEQPAEEPEEESPENPEGESTEEPAGEQEEEPEEQPAENPEEEPTEEEPVEEPEEGSAEESEEESEGEPEEEPEEDPATPTDLEPVEIRLDAVDSDVEAYILFMSDAGIPEDAQLDIRELTPAEQEAYQAYTARALNAEDESYLRYTKYLEFTLLCNGGAIRLNAPVRVTVILPDVYEGADALQVVCFADMNPVLLDSERTDNAISFETDIFDVFGIGNALVPVTNQETELAKVEVLSFSEDAPVSLSEAEAPEVVEGLEVLGTFTIEDNMAEVSDTGDQEGLYIKAELKDGAELDQMEGVALYSVDENGNTDILMEELTEEAKITELEATQVAVIKDTGYRHLTLTVNPDETTDDQIVTLDGMMPKGAEAAIEEITEAHAAANGMEIAQTDTTETAEGEASETAGEDAGPDTANAVPETINAETPEEDNAEASEAETEDEPVEEQVPEEEPKAKLIAAYDITILNGTEEYQPDEEKPISVEIIDSRITTDKNIQLWHIMDDGTREQVTEFTLEEGKIVFEAAGFSVYEIVDAPEPIESSNTIQTLQDLKNYYMDSGTAVAFHLSYNSASPKYCTNSVNNKDAFVENSNETAASDWYFEYTGTGYEFKVYTYDNGIQKYMQQLTTNNNCNMGLTTDNSKAVIFDLSSPENGKFEFKVKGQDRWLQHSNGGGGMRLYTDNKNTTNARIMITRAVSISIPNDPYELDGKTFGLMSYTDDIPFGEGLSATAKSASTLKSLELLVRSDPLDQDGALYVAKDSDLPLWTFNYVEEDRYKLSTTVDGTEKYLKIAANSLTLVSEADATAFTVVPGQGQYSNKIRLSADGWTVSYYGDLKNASASRFEATQADRAGNWLNLVQLSDLTEDDFVVYSAQKVSVSYKEPGEGEEEKLQVTNGSRIVIYTRIWNDAKSRYEFYAMDHDGTLVPCYESGDSIVWIGNRINSMSWTFTEYYNDAGQPNYYYELQNDYSGMYIAPQIRAGQILSEVKHGINIPGRKVGDYYSEIMAWDDDYYTYAALKTDKGRVTSCPINKAEQFYFAIISTAAAGELEEVPTIDHTQYGITMKMVDFDTRDRQNTAISGNSNGTGTLDGTHKGLLTTNLDENGYPTATKTETNFSTLFAGAQIVNNLFIASTHSGSGYFEYDSTQNFATLRRKDGTLGSNFRVYKELGSMETGTNVSEKPSLQHGQFMPYNDIAPGVFNTTKNLYNLYDAATNPLPENNPRKYERLYKVNNPDHYFGMMIEAGFVQTPSGKDAWDHPIIYEFTGDDDFWLYVDGELVIDLGGTHSAVAGSVNYMTGVVKQANSPNRTLRQIFESNYRTRNPNASDSEVNAYLAEFFEDGEDWFKDYSTHTMTIFYMERGAGASNLHMRFNLADVRPGQVLLTKTVSGSEDSNFNLAEYAFQIWLKTEGEDDYHRLTQMNGKKYNVQYLNSSVEVKYAASYTPPGSNTVYNDVFFLNPGKSVTISFPNEIEDYYIVECGINKNVYEAVRVNGSLVEPTAETANENRRDYAIAAEKVKDRPTVTYDNEVSPSAIRTLTFKKVLYDADGTTVLTYLDPDSPDFDPLQNDTQTFDLRLYLGTENEEIDSLVPASFQVYYIRDTAGRYCKWDANRRKFVPVGEGDGITRYETLVAQGLEEYAEFLTSPNGAISRIPAGYTIEVRGLLLGSKFEFEERDSEVPDGFTFVEYRNDGNSYEQAHGRPNCGTILRKEDPSGEIVNRRGWGITVEKKWSDSSFVRSRDPIYVAIYRNNGDGENIVPGTVRKIEYPNKSTYYFFDQINDGEDQYSFDQYYARELTVTQFDEDGNPSVYTPIQPGGFVAYGWPEQQKPAESDRSYTVTYKQGTPTGTSGNVRTDTIMNTRGGGIDFYLEEWGTGTALENGTFELQIWNDAENKYVNVGAGTYTSDDMGLITILYDFVPNTQYRLVQTESPAGHIGLDEPVYLVVEQQSGQNDRVVVTGPSGYYELVTVGNATGNELIAHVYVKNKKFTLEAIKIDGETRVGLNGAVFVLYKEVESVSGDLMQSYYPMAGYTELSSQLNTATNTKGVIQKIDDTLPAGGYYLVEKLPPTGYKAAGKPVRIVISKLGEVEVDTNTAKYTGTLTSQTDANDVIHYTITVPNEATDMRPPYLTITKFVTGDMGDTTKQFPFTISGLKPGEPYPYVKYITEDGESWAPENSTGDNEVREASNDGEITITLKHNERVVISMYFLPENPLIRVYENSGSYSSSYVLNSGSPVASNVADNIVIAEGMDADIIFTNTLNVIAPTGIRMKEMPYLFMMIGGMLLLIIMGGISIKQRGRKREQEINTGPSLRRARNGPGAQGDPKGIPRGSAPPSPICPRAYLWAQPDRSPGKRGDPGR